LTIKNKTKEEKNIKKIVLLGSTFAIILISLTLGFVLINLQIKEFKIHLDTFQKTLIQREKITIKTAIENLRDDILYEQKAQQHRIKQNIKKQTKIAQKIANLIYLKNKKNDRNSIIKNIKNAIQNISINEENIDYFIFDKDGTYLLNTKYKSYEGENFIDFIDINNKKFIQEIINKSKDSNSFVDFLWYMPGSSKIKKKITYSKYIFGLDIVIGSSRYAENNNLVIKYLKDKLKKRRLSNDDFVFIYKINSLSNIKKYSIPILAKNIKTSEQTVDFMEKILIKSQYAGNIFFKEKNKLLYSTFLKNQRLFISFGVDLKRINSIIKQETKNSNKNLQEKIVSLILIISFVTLVFFLLSYAVAQKIEKIFKNYKLKVISNERKYQLLFNHSNDGFIISKVTKDKKAFIISTNTLAKKLSGYGVDLIGRDFFELFEKINKKTLFETNEILDKVLLITKGKLRKHIELSCVLYKHEEETLLFSSLRDISERIQLKIEKEEQEKLLIQKSKMASMGEMIGNIAHQWRQPISELSGLFFDIESAYDYGELDKKYLSKRIDEANDLVEYMSKTIDDFREFYNPNSKKEKFYLAKNIQRTLKIIHSSFKYHNIKVHLDIDQNICIDGYSNEFSQVLLNILSNSKETALIRDIKKPKIEIFTQKKKNKIFLHIEDNCGGIEEKILDRIFEPYFTTKYNYGTGIGLYMSQIIIENKMQGKIFAKNTKKNGVRFTIVL